MQCTEGRAGRIFVLRIDHGEDLLESLLQCIREKQIHCGTVQVLGALGEAHLVTGPEEPVLPPVPHHEKVDGGWEVLGIGSISWGEDGPHLHLHSAVGRGSQSLAGCLRDKARAYIVVEATITEIAGIHAVRGHDEVTGLHLPRFLPGSPP
ncbi:MAG: hypothetical protein A4E37_01964 [Methanoregulaceae archaeon PtaB.Bin056]|jgi:hypothetical protein|nr:MAG: hypothetical protein A4E37_01964 [Methanoregulaceae archaeon PtaB.Bin056]